MAPELSDPLVSSRSNDSVETVIGPVPQALSDAPVVRGYMPNPAGADTGIDQAIAARLVGKTGFDRGGAQIENITLATAVIDFDAIIVLSGIGLLRVGELTFAMERGNMFFLRDADAVVSGSPSVRIRKVNLQ